MPLPDGGILLYQFQTVFLKRADFYYCVSFKYIKGKKWGIFPIFVDLRMTSFLWKILWMSRTILLSIDINYQRLRGLGLVWPHMCS